ncbi:hypothetical protein GN244_ATG07970 [Phytophthora infestans]|uniref:Uncharacterized protein n=1 Tax=Phytophthora infestans TaxID=4787 RepID=A0A833WW93_PHYIN|nr:hypothetical protein GN244_ATG07970 [Phytophthora infestans]
MWKSKQQRRVTKNTCASELEGIVNRGNSKRVQRYAKEAMMIVEFVDDRVVKIKKLSMEDVRSALVNMQAELEKVD